MVNYFKIFFSPKSFFESVSEKNYIAIWLAYFIPYFSMTLISILFSLVTNPIMLLIISAFPEFIVFYIIFLLLALVTFPFIASFFSHLATIIFGGREGYIKTYNVVTYTLFIPFVFSLVYFVISILINLLLAFY